MFMSHNCWSHLMYFTEGRHHSVMWPNVNELRWPDLLNITCPLIFIRIYHLRNGNISLNKRKSVFYKDFSYSYHFRCPLLLSIYTELKWESKLCFSSVTYFSSHLHSSTALIICHFNLLFNSSIFHTELCSSIHFLIVLSLTLYSGHGYLPWNT